MRIDANLTYTALAVLLGSILSGCGGNAERYDVVPVSGIVTCQGKPVANAVVNFTPMAQEGRAEGRPGRVALGITDDQGRFKLTTYVNDDGAIVGKHTVTVGLNIDENSAPPTERFPCRDSSMEITLEKPIDDLKLDF
jgi:hypothetical protein